MRYDTDSENLKNNFRENQMEEREEIDRRLTETLEGKLRPTPKLLNMQFRLEQLSRAQRFEEAAKLKLEFEDEVGIPIK